MRLEHGVWPTLTRGESYRALLVREELYMPQGVTRADPAHKRLYFRPRHWLELKQPALVSAAGLHDTTRGTIDSHISTMSGI
jgi:hypothetical protein